MSRVAKVEEQNLKQQNFEEYKSRIASLQALILAKNEAIDELNCQLKNQSVHDLNEMNITMTENSESEFPITETPSIKEIRNQKLESKVQMQVKFKDLIKKFRY